MRHIILMFNLSCGTWQDVIDIMKESLYDKYVDEHGYVDFARSGGMSQPKESKRFLNALNKEAELQQKDRFSRTVSHVANLVFKFNYHSESALFGRKATTAV